MYSCGLRISEAVKLRVSEIDVDRMVIRVVGKGNKERLVPMPQSLLQDLRLLWMTHRHCEWLFPNKHRNNHISTSVVGYTFREARAATLPNVRVTPHGLRHSYATRLLELGVDVGTVCILLGHANIKTTQTYLHMTEPLRRQINETVDTFFVSFFD